jgi:hypothetical protein
MELVVFLVGGFILMLWIARDRIGGRSRTPSEESDFEGNRPIGYGEFVAPPGTAPGASVNAPYFRSDHSGQGQQSHGPGE